VSIVVADFGIRWCYKGGWQSKHGQDDGVDETNADLLVWVANHAGSTSFHYGKVIVVVVGQVDCCSDLCMAITAAAAADIRVAAAAVRIVAVADTDLLFHPTEVSFLIQELCWHTGATSRYNWY